MYICGCKLSQQAPFCDGITCASILKGEEVSAPLGVLAEESED